MYKTEKCASLKFNEYNFIQILLATVLLQGRYFEQRKGYPWPIVKKQWITKQVIKGEKEGVFWLRNMFKISVEIEVINSRLTEALLAFGRAQRSKAAAIGCALKQSTTSFVCYN
ncbi:hypothetical protein [Microscilla marina]|uniref:hypothetical protein n=1 Tax=Microscilla marina TaxID=1027 RepID=UPI0012F90CFA|nr:hypothetical protein [Microscilla marina]